MNKTNPMTPIEVNNYVRSRGILLPNGQVFITSHMRVFKKVLVWGPRGDVRGILPPLTTSEERFYTKRLDSCIKRGTCEEGIANLVIPKGAIVNLAGEYPHNKNATNCSDKKLRASTAFCWSIVRIFDFVEVPIATSYHVKSFYYRSVKSLDDKIKVRNLTSSYGEPSNMLMGTLKGFDTSNKECSTGIHFFLELQSAIDY